MGWWTVGRTGRDSHVAQLSLIEWVDSRSPSTETGALVLMGHPEALFHQAFVWRGVALVCGSTPNPFRMVGNSREGPLLPSGWARPWSQDTPRCTWSKLQPGISLGSSEQRGPCLPPLAGDQSGLHSSSRGEISAEAIRAQGKCSLSQTLALSFAPRKATSPIPSTEPRPHPGKSTSG